MVTIEVDNRWFLDEDGPVLCALGLVVVRSLQRRRSLGFEGADGLLGLGRGVGELLSLRLDHRAVSSQDLQERQRLFLLWLATESL